MDVSTHIDKASSDRRLTDPIRLQALKNSIPFDANHNAALDRLTRVASQILHTPITIVSFLGADKQYLRSFYGFPESMTKVSFFPISDSICRYTLSGEILALEDLRNEPALSQNVSIQALKLASYLGVPLIDDEGNGLGTVCTVDIKPRKWTRAEISLLEDLTFVVKSELDLQHDLNRLRRIQDIREKAISLVAHDLREPIAAIDEYARAMEESFDDEGFSKQALSAIHRLAAKSLNLMENYLDQSAADQNLLEHQRSRINLNQCVEEIIQDLELLYGKRFRFQHADAELSCSFVRQDFITAFENLVVNAIKYGERDASINIYFETFADGSVAVCIHNFGEPISESDIKALLKTSFRTSNAQKSGAKGWGLGLEFVKNVLSNHEGELQIISSARDGTTFIMKIPLIA